MKALLPLIPALLVSCSNLDSSFSALYQDPETGVVVEYKITEKKTVQPSQIGPDSQKIPVGKLTPGKLKSEFNLSMKPQTVTVEVDPDATHPIIENSQK